MNLLIGNLKYISCVQYTGSLGTNGFPIRNPLRRTQCHSLICGYERQVMSRTGWSTQIGVEPSKLLPIRRCILPSLSYAVLNSHRKLNICCKVVYLDPILMLSSNFHLDFN